MVRGRALLTFLLLLAGSGQSAAQGGESVAPQPMQEGGRGFGDAISWFSFDDGLRAAEAQAKPALVVIHKSWCGACRSLGPAFAASAEITALASEFIMINVRDDEEPRDASWHPDGSYIPRIFFYDGGMGELLDDITCSSPRDDGKYKHFCSDPALIAQGMRAVLTRRQHQKDLEDQVANSLPGDKAGGERKEHAEAEKTEL